MKRFYSLITLCVVVVLLAGCGFRETRKENVPQKEEVAQKETTNEKIYGLEKVSPAEGISITFNSYGVNPPKGDKSKDGANQENGEYFSLGNNVVKTSEYNEVTYGIIVKNDTEKTINFSAYGWGAKLKEENLSTALNMSGSIIDKVLPKSSGKGSIKIITKNDVDPNEILLTYKYLDYNDEWSKAFKDYKSGKLSEVEYSKKFKPIPITWKIVIP